MRRSFCLFVLFFLLSRCDSRLIIRFEEIHAPVSLQILELSPLVYELNFFSDNRETGFSGYRVYAEATREQVIEAQRSQFENNKNFVREPGWCPISVDLDFSKRIRIQIQGNDLRQGFQCVVNDIMPFPGGFVAVRAGVERDCANISSDDCFPWSQAAAVAVPP